MHGGGGKERGKILPRVHYSYSPQIAYKSAQQILTWHITTYNKKHTNDIKIVETSAWWCGP